MNKLAIVCFVSLVFWGSSLFAQIFDTIQLRGVNSTSSSVLSGGAVDPLNGDFLMVGSFAGQLEQNGTELNSKGLTDVFLLRVNPQGTVQWATGAGGDKADSGNQVAVDSQGHAYATGAFLDQAVFGTLGAEWVLSGNPEEATAFVSQYSPNGSVQWAQALTGPAMSQGFDIDVGLSGDLYIAGRYIGTSLVPGDKNISSFQDGFLLKVNSEDGEILWGQRLGSETADSSTSCELGADGRVYVAGLLGDSVFVEARNAETGEKINDFSVVQQEIGTAGYHPDLALGTDGRIYVVGAFEGEQTFENTQLKSQGGADIFVACYTKLGWPLFARSFGSAGDDAALGVAVKDNGLVLVVGELGGIVQFGETAVGQSGQSDGFVALLGRDGDILDVQGAGGQDGTEQRMVDAVLDDKGSLLVGEFEHDFQFNGMHLPSASLGHSGFWAACDRLRFCPLCFEKGWNLSALCRQPETSSVTDLFAELGDTLLSVWAWQNGTWSVYFPQWNAVETEEYITQKGFSALEAVPFGQGIWVEAKESDVMHITGSLPQQEMQLQSGWNLLGLTDADSQEVFSLFAEKVCQVQSVWKWKNETWHLALPGASGNLPDLIQSKGYEELTEIEPGEGFWVNYSVATEPLEVEQLSFNSGWNLAALSRQPENTSVDKLFWELGDTLSSVWGWQNDHWAVYLPGVGPQETQIYAAQKGFSVLETISYGQGFWVNLDEQGVIHIAGSQEGQDLELISGWNLLGLSGGESQALPDLIAGMADHVQSVWKWKNENWHVALPSNPDHSVEFAQSKGFVVLQEINPGEGFWVHYE